MNEKTGIRAVMGDIQEILHVGSREYLNLSAGNPMILQETAAMWQAVLERLLENGTFLSAISQYGSSYGTDELINSVVRFFSHRYGHDIEKENVLITAGLRSIHFAAWEATVS